MQCISTKSEACSVERDVYHSVTDCVRRPAQGPAARRATCRSDLHIIWLVRQAQTVEMTSKGAARPNIFKAHESLIATCSSVCFVAGPEWCGASHVDQIVHQVTLM